MLDMVSVLGIRAGRSDRVGITLGSNLSAGGASLVVVKELMRHSDIKTTLRHYADVSQLPLAEAVAKLPALVVPKVPKSNIKTDTKKGVA